MYVGTNISNLCHPTYDNITCARFNHKGSWVVSVSEMVSVNKTYHSTDTIKSPIGIKLQAGTEQT